MNNIYWSLIFYVFIAVSCCITRVVHVQVCETGVHAAAGSADGNITLLELSENLVQCSRYCKMQRVTKIFC
jgi:hypothetical protein